MDVVTETGSPLADSVHAFAESLTFGAVDVLWTSPLRNVVRSAHESSAFAGALRKPSDGLEPSTPFLTIDRQPVASHGNGFRLPGPFFRLSHLRTVATSCARWAPSRLHSLCRAEAVTSHTLGIS